VPRPNGLPSDIDLRDIFQPHFNHNQQQLSEPASRIMSLGIDGFNNTTASILSRDEVGGKNQLVLKAHTNQRIYLGLCGLKFTPRLLLKGCIGCAEGFLLHENCVSDCELLPEWKQ
jgi:hypothetical protein